MSLHEEMQALSEHAATLGVKMSLMFAGPTGPDEKSVSGVLITRNDKLVSDDTVAGIVFQMYETMRKYGHHGCDERLEEIYSSEGVRIHRKTPCPSCSTAKLGIGFQAVSAVRMRAICKDCLSVLFDGTAAANVPTSMEEEGSRDVMARVLASGNAVFMDPVTGKMQTAVPSEKLAKRIAEIAKKDTKKTALSCSPPPTTRDAKTGEVRAATLDDVCGSQILAIGWMRGFGMTDVDFAAASAASIRRAKLPPPQKKGE